MKNLVKISLLSASLAAILLPASAQSTNASQPTPSASNPPSSVQQAPSGANNVESNQKVQQRKYWQQDRIKNGVSNGSLTAGEAGSLEKQESNINKEEQQMKAADNGNLTLQDRQKLQRQQNQLSHEIYQDKHNGATQNMHPQGEIGKRAENQQDRIAGGLQSGQLTAGEASNLENKEAAINHEAATDRATNGGKLTQAEKQQINRQQNQVSKQIYKDKHNKAHR